MRLTQRLLFGFGVVISLLVTFGVIITGLANHTLSSFDQITQVAQPILRSATEMESATASISARVEEYLRTSAPQARQDLLELESDFETYLNEFNTHISSTGQEALAEQISTLYPDYKRNALLRVAAFDIEQVVLESITRELIAISEQLEVIHELVPQDNPAFREQHELVDNFSTQIFLLRATVAGYRTDLVGGTSQMEETLENARSLLTALTTSELNEVQRTALAPVLREFRYIEREVPYLATLANEIDGYSTAFSSVSEQLGALIEDQAEPMATRLSDTANIAATQSATTTRSAVIFLIVSGVVAGLVTTLRVTRYVSKGFKTLEKGAEQIGGGNLKHRIEIATKDELGDLAHAFNSMAEKAERNVETLRVARREAEDANRMKDMFLATMSHELRTPLNAMIGFMHLMLFSGQLDEDNAHMANRSLANSQRLLTLINNMLDLSRIATGALQIVPVDIRLRELVAALYGDMKPLANEKSLDLQTEIDPDLPTVIHHDGDRLMQIMTNLTHNAVKFTEAGSVKLSVRCRDERLVIQVSDTGIGIPTSKQHMIFDDFFQVDPSSKRTHQGAGLGLAIVKRLALMMDGTIRVESEIDQGSTFTVELPLNLPALSADAAPSRSAVFTHPNGNRKFAPVATIG